MNNKSLLIDCINLCRERREQFAKGINDGGYPALYIREWKKQHDIYLMLEKLAEEKKEQMG